MKIFSILGFAPAGGWANYHKKGHEKVHENSTLDQDDAVTSMMAEVESVKLPNSVDDSKFLVNKLNEVDIGASKKTHDATNEEAISNSQQSTVG